MNSVNVNEQIRLVMDSCPMGVAYYNSSRALVCCNGEALKICRVANKDELATYLLISEQSSLLFDTAVAECRATAEIMHNDATGVARHLEVTLAKIDTADGGGFIAYIHDLSSTRADSLAKNQAMELTRKLLDNAPVLIELWEEEGTKCIGCNKYLMDTFGLTDEREFTEGDNWEKFSAPIQSCGTPASVLNPYWITKAAKEGSSSGDWLFVLPNGEELPAYSTWVQIEHHGTSMIIVYSIDVRPVRAAMQSEEHSKAKSRFLARMSHEIRTPLSAVLSISELQLRNQSLSTQTEEAFSKIYDSSKTLLHIVNDILDFSKIESGKMTLRNSEYDVASLVGDAAQLHFMYSERKNVKFEMNVDENLPAKLVGDAFRIRQIITNLLTNAFKYTENGKVVLSLKCTKPNGREKKHTSLIISITDTGMGMSAAQLNDLKGEYVRLHEKIRPFVSGTGLGIPIVSSLAHMMKAQLEITSEINEGTTAVVKIPQQIVGTEVLGQSLASSLQNFETKTWSFSKEFEFTPESLPRGNILVVDDVDTNLYIAEAMLQSFGLDVDVCESARKALDKIATGNQYDVIFLDYMMPEMDGIELAKILREMGYNGPIVALTANAVKGEAEMFMDSGFSGFMSKPIDIKLLHSYLMRFLVESQI